MYVWTSPHQYHVKLSVFLAQASDCSEEGKVFCEDLYSTALQPVLEKNVNVEKNN